MGSYKLFRRGEPLDAAVWDKLMLGLTTRNYAPAVREFAAAYGIEKSTVSEHFVHVTPSARIFNLMFYIPTFQRPSASLFIGARAR